MNVSYPMLGIPFFCQLPMDMSERELNIIYILLKLNQMVLIQIEVVRGVGLFYMFDKTRTDALRPHVVKPYVVYQFFFRVQSAFSLLALYLFLSISLVLSHMHIALCIRNQK